MNIDYQLNYECATTTYIGTTKLTSVSHLERTATLMVRSVVIGSAIYCMHLSAIKEKLYS